MEPNPRTKPLHRDLSFWIVVVTLVGAANIAQLYFGIPWMRAKIANARPAPRTPTADRPAMQDVFTRAEPELDRSKKTFPWQVPEFDPAALQNAPEQVVLIPSEFKAPSGGWSVNRNQKHIGIRRTAPQVVESAYNWHRPTRTIWNTDTPEGEFDFIASLNSGATEALQSEIRSRWNLAAHRERIRTNVFVLRVRHTNAPGMKPGVSGNMRVQVNQNILSFSSAGLEFLASHIEGWVRRPVLDETGLSGTYDFNLPRYQPSRLAGVQVSNPAAHFQNVLPEHLGLELIETNLPVEMLVVTPAH